MIRTAFSRKLRDANFRFAMIGIGLCVVLLILTTRIGDKRVADMKLQRPSSFFTDDTGTRAIYLVLRRLLPAAEQWRRPLTQLVSPTHPDAPTTLIIFAPHRPIALRQAAALDSWIEQGGQVILVTHQDWPIKRAERGAQAGDDEVSESEATAMDTYLGRHGLQIRKRTDRDNEQRLTPPLLLDRYHVTSAEDTEVDHPRMTTGTDVRVGSKRIGQGRLVVVPDTAAFANQRLRTSQNAVWLVTLCATWGNGRVLIDEFHQGFGVQRGLLVLLGLFLGTPWGWVCAQVALAGLLYVFGTLRRFGRAYDPLPESFGSPVDLLEARRGLFATARARRLAAEMMHQHLQYRLGKHVGYTMNLADPTTHHRLLRMAPALAQHVEQYLPRVQDALDGDTISDRELIEMGQFAARIQKELTTR